MEFIISTRVLSDGLKKIDFELESVKYAKIINSYLYLDTFERENIKIGFIEQTSFNKSESGTTVSQDCRRWDWIANLVNRIPEQPIQLKLEPQNTQVIFNY